VNRRDAIKNVSLAILAARSSRSQRIIAQLSSASPSSKADAINALQLEPFVDPLLLPIQLKSEGLHTSPKHGVQNAPLFRVTMREIHTRMHRDLAPTRMWSYGHDAVAPLLEAHSNKEISVEWINRLPKNHFLPIDYTLHGSGRELPDSRTVTHVHGGRTPAASDGYPEHWFSTGDSTVSHYPNRQDAAMLWYHDHAMGTSRLNLYAGLMGMYLLRDEHEATLGLPSGPYELPLMLYDRMFDGNGQLFYPVSSDPKRPWVEEVFGDAMVVNGRVQPFHIVEARRYRLRMVNASNGRFFRLALSNGASFQQIGADQGFLPQPVKLETIVLAPGERADLIVDFAPMRGQQVALTNGAFQMMQFRVGSSAVSDASQVPATLLPSPPMQEGSAVRSRELTLNQYDSPEGLAMVMLLNRTPWHAPVTEVAKLNTTEIWSFVNLTDDAHPIHLHHVRFRILDRRPFDRDRYLLKNAELHSTGPALGPKPNESGWKDVVQCPPNIVTRIHVSFDGYPGRYLWHCHLQEHEANDMMRPYDIEL
jgi:spore coat protein A